MITGQVNVDWNGGFWTMHYERTFEGITPIRYECNGFMDAEPPAVVEDLCIQAAYAEDEPDLFDE